MRPYLFVLALLACFQFIVPARADDAKDAELLQRNLAQAIADTLAKPRTGLDGIVTASDADIYAQCRQSTLLKAWRCEAAGTRMQPSLHLLLTRKRRAALKQLGFTVDRTFGNFIMAVPMDTAPSALAKTLIQALVDGYGTDLGKVQIDTLYLPTRACPTRVGWTQTHAGAINVWPDMKNVSAPFCSAAAARRVAKAMGNNPEQGPGPYVTAPANQHQNDIVAAYTPSVVRELARIRQAEEKDDPWFVLDTPVGYVQCAPDNDHFYCEAASAESVPELKAQLTPEHRDILHKAGYEDPGRHQNYVALYPYKDFSDAKLAVLLLSVLRDVYGYNGQTLLRAIDTQHPKGRILATE